MTIKEFDCRYKNIQKLKYGYGSTAQCFSLDNGDVYKKFFYYRSLADIDKYKYFLEYTNDSFFFPYDFVYDNDYFYGYISHNTLGKPLAYIANSASILELAKNAIHLEQNINYISTGKILVADIHNRNIMYDYNKYTVVDFDSYIYDKLNNITEIKKANLNSFRISIGNIFYYNINSNRYTNYILNCAQLFQNKSEMLISDMIFEINNRIIDCFGNDVKSIDDINKVTAPKTNIIEKIFGRKGYIKW